MRKHKLDDNVNVAATAFFDMTNTLTKMDYPLFKQDLSVYRFARMLMEDF